MCGIAGICNFGGKDPISWEALAAMIAVLRHRGPDDCGYYQEEHVGLAHSRLSIIDLDGGRQPIPNEDRSVWITFNGEIFNYIELRDFLIKKGHRFSTKSDTEVIIHLYEDYGTDCLSYLNGQFAFAIWDREKKTLFVARDRIGIRPVFYAQVNGTFLFASEIKAILMHKGIQREIDLRALDQIFTFWTTIPPRTAFRNIYELPAGCFLTVKGNAVQTKRYWDVDFSASENIQSEAEYAEQLRELLIDATRLQLRADVPVGAYLSGGIDSSVITALIKKFTDTPLRTFSVTFEDDAYDESAYQNEMINYLGTEHSDIRCTYSDIGNVLPDVMWHTEMPILRTAPAPLFLLSLLVRQNGYKVVLTGEGSDEILAGYDIFKETKVRRFIERYPESKFRRFILKRLYPYLEHSPVRSLSYAEAFFTVDTSPYPAHFYSHVPRWLTTSKTKFFFSDHVKDVIGGHNTIDELSQLLRGEISHYDDLSKAQYIEMKTLLPGYILSSQGDRVGMAHAIEGRFPFLDHRLIEFCAQLPPFIRMKTLEEKYILKESMRDLLPVSIVRRKKQPYMAPDYQSFFKGNAPAYVDELLSTNYLEKTQYFNAQTVSGLVKKVRQNQVIGFRDNMAVVGILTTLLLHHMFIEEFDSRSRSIREELIRSESYAGKV